MSFSYTSISDSVNINFFSAITGNGRKSKKLNINRYFLLIILGGSLGNFFDRIYYSAVPDFIDIHIGDFHWFIFNIADVFISIGIICLIFVEIFGKNINKGKDE